MLCKTFTSQVVFIIYASCKLQRNTSISLKRLLYMLSPVYPYMELNAYEKEKYYTQYVTVLTVSCNVTYVILCAMQGVHTHRSIRAEFTRSCMMHAIFR